jgi:hypothetical protein
MLHTHRVGERSYGQLRGPSVTGVNQEVQWHQPFDRTGKIGESDRHGWPVDDLGTPDFDWSDGDGTTPNVGPVLTASGDPTAGKKTPWIRQGGTAITCTAFGANEHLKHTASALDPSAGDSIVGVAFVRTQTIGGATRYLLSTRNAGGGAGFYIAVSNTWIAILSHDGVDFAQSSATIPAGGWFLVSFSWILGDKQYLYVNGALADSDSVEAVGVPISGNGIAINAGTDGLSDDVGDIARVMLFYGADIGASADADWHRELAHHVLGSGNLQGRHQATFTRASSGAHKVGSRYHIFGQHAPRVCCGNKCLVEPSGTNKVFNNGYNPSAITGWSATGGTLSTTSDIGNLSTGGIREFGPSAFSFINDSGSTQYVVSKGLSTAGVDAHSLSLFANLVSAANVKLGLWGVASAAYDNGGTISDSYARTEVDNHTPASSDAKLAIEVPNACKITFAMAQLETGAYATSPIVNTATAAAATRAQDIMNTTITPNDTEGSVELGITPNGWSGTSPGADGNIVTRSGGSAELVRYESSDGSYAAEDGTNTANVTTVNPADGVRKVIRTRWGNGDLSIDVGGTRDTTDYDGALQASGTVQIQSSVPVLIDNFKILGDGRG